MDIYLKNNHTGPLLCRSGTAQPICLPPGETMRIPAEDNTLTVSFPYGSHSDSEGIHIVLDTVFSFAGLEDGDTVELFREKTAAAAIKGMMGQVWYDRAVACCRVTDPPRARHTIAEEETLRQELKASYHRELRWEIVWETVLDVGFELLLELGGTVVLFILLWITYSFGKALLIAGGLLLAFGLLTLIINFLLEYPRQRRQYKQLLFYLQPDTIAACCTTAI